MKLTICGDLCPAKFNQPFMENSLETLFGGTLEVIREADRALVNLECAITDSTYAIKKYGPNLMISPGCADVIKAAGFTDCMLANNHIFDAGTQGALDTLANLERVGLNYTGFGKNAEDARKDLIIEKDGLRVAVIDVCEHEYCYALEDRMGAREYDFFYTLQDIAKAKAENDRVIVIYHGGKEMCEYPSPRLRKTCQSFVWHGADVVLCQHSHCIGTYEQYEGGHILYGQGNFHFLKLFQGVPKMYETGLMVKLDITDEVKIEFVPTVIHDDGIDLAKGEKYDEIMKAFAQRNQSFADGTWMDGWRDFCERSKENYLRALAGAYVEKEDGSNGAELFAHYFRCEAHHDVWEELCKLSWETREEP